MIADDHPSLVEWFMFGGSWQAFVLPVVFIGVPVLLAAAWSRFTNRKEGNDRH